MSGAGRHRARKERRGLRSRFSALRASLIEVHEQPTTVALSPVGASVLDSVPWPTLTGRVTPTLPPAPPGLVEASTITNPVDLVVADIDPSNEIPALPVAASDARAAVDALHDAYPGLPQLMPWKYDFDGARLSLDTTPMTAKELRGAVAAYAAALAARVEEREQEPSGSGRVTLTVAGEYRGVRVAVSATAIPDPDERLEKIHREFRAEDDTQQFDPIADDAGPPALPAPQGAA